MIANDLDPTPFERYFELRHSRSKHLGVSRNVRAFLAELSKRMTDVEWLRDYADACPVPDTTPEDYAPRLLRLDTNCSVIAAIHFRGLNLDFPFVDIAEQSGPLPQSLLAAVAPFSVFRPRAVRVWRSECDALSHNTQDDLLVLAGHIPTLLASAPLPHAERIRFEPDPSLQSYPDYRAFHAAHPGRTSFSQPEDEASLQRCVQSGAFFRVSVDGALAGFIAARPESFRGWHGWNMVEEMLHPDFRGQGLAPAMQQAFLRTLDLRQSATVLGTIDANNIPSRKTALRVGRHIAEIGTFIFLDKD